MAKAARSKSILNGNSYAFLEKYINNPSPTGFESGGQKIWMDYLRPYADEFFTDPYGTAVGVINPGTNFKVVIEAHADEISWFVNYISDNGLIYLKRNGGVDHQIAPSMRVAIHGKKGKVRANLVRNIFDSVKNNGLTAMITRSADFYGANVSTGFLNIGVINNLKKNKKSFWQSDVNRIHSFTYVPDAAKAVALLGNTPDAYNQTWHLPTSSEKWTGKDFINQVAAQLNVRPRYYILSKFIISLLGFFSSDIRELNEMQYQNDQDYFFDSRKFQQRFSFNPTSYEEGIRQSVS